MSFEQAFGKGKLTEAGKVAPEAELRRFNKMITERYEEVYGDDMKDSGTPQTAIRDLNYLS